MIRRFQLFTILGLAGAMSCSASSDPLSPDERRNLDRAEAKWTARAFVDYTFETRVVCFCAPQVTQWTRVTVEGGKVTAAVPADQDTLYTPPMLELWQPVDSLFSMIRSALRDGDAYLKAIDVMFDEEWGYPTRVSFISKPEIQDGGSTHYVRNLIPKP